MGALTLKSFPFELRGWDIEKFESIDPTDGFGSNTRIYVSKDQIVQIEPDYDINTFNTWLTNKGRQFFDGVFGPWSSEKRTKNELVIESKSWLGLVSTLTQTIFISKLCRKRQNDKQFFTIVFENLSIEILSMLLIFSQNHSFLKLRRAENYELNNDLETNFQLNLARKKVKLNNSTLCLLISNNPRYEGYYLNLNLRQRFFKGNFKCLMIGSLIDLTFPVSFLGSNLNILNTIAEGNNITCQELKISKNPILVFNQELLKRNDGKNTIEVFKILKYTNIFNSTWNGINMLNSSLSDGGINYLNKFLPLSLNDLNNSNSLYFLNVSTHKINNLKKIINLKLFNYTLSKKKKVSYKQTVLDQNSKLNNNFRFYTNFYSTQEQKHTNFISIPSNSFYENDETYVNTEGLTKHVTKLIFRKKTKNSWQILRQIFKHLDKKLVLLNQTEKNLILFNSKRITNFKNYINFQYFAVKNLTNISFYLTTKNSSFIISNNIENFKSKRVKFTQTKLKYWLDDFFSGGKDEYSEHSLVMTNCSKTLRSETTNFF
jgi:NADH dehydrogenase/NADH:ubiquinone oxidoreductase subunit G